MGQMFPANDLSTQLLGWRWVKVVHKDDLAYLESSVGIPPAHPKTFDRHGKPQIYPTVHICEPTTVASPLDVDEFQSKKVRGGYDAVGFAYFGK